MCKRFLLVMTGVVLVSLLLCPVGGAAKKDPYGPPPWKIGFSNISLVNTWRTQLQMEVCVEARKHKDVIANLYVTNAENRVEKQISDIEDLVVKGIDLLLITPASPTALNSTIRRVYEQGIAVVIFSETATTEKYTARVHSDDVGYGRVMAEWLVEQLNGEGKILVLRGIPGNSCDIGRWKGGEEVFKKYPGIKILASDYGDWAYDKGKRISEEMLAAHPHVDGVWSSGAAMSQGCFEAILEAKRPIIPISGEDNNGFMKMWVKYMDKGFSSIAPCYPTYMGQIAVQVALKILKGEEYPDTTWVTPEPITNEEIANYVRPDLPDSYWALTHLPKKVVDAYYKEGDMSYLFGF